MCSALLRLGFAANRRLSVANTRRRSVMDSNHGQHNNAHMAVGSSTKHPLNAFSSTTTPPSVVLQAQQEVSSEQYVFTTVAKSPPASKKSSKKYHPAAPHIDFKDKQV